MVDADSLPEQWRTVKLSEVVNFTSKPRGLDPAKYESVPFIPMDAIHDDGRWNCDFT
mgnify:CR=1 FL=1